MKGFWCVRIDVAQDINKRRSPMYKDEVAEKDVTMEKHMKLTPRFMLEYGDRHAINEYFYTFYKNDDLMLGTYEDVMNMKDEINSQPGNMIIHHGRIYVAGLIVSEGDKTLRGCDRLIVYDSAVKGSWKKAASIIRSNRPVACKKLTKSHVTIIEDELSRSLCNIIVEHSTCGQWISVDQYGGKHVISDAEMFIDQNIYRHTDLSGLIEGCYFGRNVVNKDGKVEQIFRLDKQLRGQLKNILAIKESIPETDVCYDDKLKSREDLGMLVDTDYIVDYTGAIHTSERGYDVAAYVNNVDQVYGAGYSRNNMTELNIGAGVKEILPAAFNEYEELTKISIGPDVRLVGNYAFGDLLNTAECDFSNAVSLERIDMNAFNNTELISDIDLRNCNKLTEIGSSAFAVETIRFDSADSVMLPGSVLKIGKLAFNGTQADKYDLSRCIKLKTIGQHAFGGINVSEFILPDHMSKLDSGMFDSTTNIETLVFPKDGVDQIVERKREPGFNIDCIKFHKHNREQVEQFVSLWKLNEYNIDFEEIEE